MARQTFEAWIPEEDGSAVLHRVAQTSAVEALARRVPMSSDTRNEPRSGDMEVEGIAKGGLYGEDEATNDEVTLVAKKFGRAIRIAEEDIDDSLPNVLAAKQFEWATAYARFIDNATLATTAAEAGVTTPFTSVYRAVRTADVGLGYAADENYFATAAGAPIGFDDLNDELMGKAESSEWYDDSDAITIAHPSLKAQLRGLKDPTSGELLYVSAGTPGGVDTFFGRPVRWSFGARTSATATARPAGNPLMIHGSAYALMLGIRSGPESIFIDGRDGLSALTDESILKMRSRRGFAVAHPSAFSVIEVTPPI